MENNQNNSAQSNLCYIVSELLNKVIHSPLANQHEIDNSGDSTSAISNLTNAINNLARAINTLCNVVSKSSNAALPEEVATFANVAKRFKNSNTSTRPSQFTTHDTFKNKSNEQSTGNKAALRVNTATCPPPNDFMSQLANLKNARNEAHYRMRRNHLFSATYQANIEACPMRIPRKLMPNIMCHGDKALAKHRNNIAIESVKQEIQTMRIHEEKQRAKMIRIEEQIKQHIASEPDESKRRVLTRNYESIVSRSTEAIERKILAKIDSLKSIEHTMIVHEIDDIIHFPANSIVQSPQLPETMDCEMEAANFLKRKRDSVSSTASLPSQSTSATPDQIQAENQTENKKATSRHVVSMRKNLTRPIKKSRFKPRLQK